MSILQNLKDRQCDIEKYSVYVNEAENCATFYLWNLTGQLIGFQCYRPSKSKVRGKKFDYKEMKYYTHISKPDNKTTHFAVFGLETNNKKLNNLYVVEGLFDVVKLHNAGYNAIATFGASPSKTLKNWLYKMPYKTIAICDGDSAGLKLSNSTDDFIQCPDGEDPASWNGLINAVKQYEM